MLETNAEDFVKSYPKGWPVVGAGRQPSRSAQVERDNEGRDFAPVQHVGRSWSELAGLPGAGVDPGYKIAAPRRRAATSATAPRSLRSSSLGGVVIGRRPPGDCRQPDQPPHDGEGRSIADRPGRASPSPAPPASPGDRDGRCSNANSSTTRRSRVTPDVARGQGRPAVGHGPNHLPAAMQGLAVVPLFAGYDRRRRKGRLFAYDVTGGRYEEENYVASGSVRSTPDRHPRWARDPTGRLGRPRRRPSC
ncbi:MAG: hypothetical protein R2710_17695 [Acidimicrobiales bacterium]